MEIRLFMFNPRRQTTIFDISSLKVHPNGTRIDVTNEQLLQKRRRKAVHDAKGNLIAKDAGGDLVVRRHKSKAEEDKAGESSNLPEREMGPKCMRRAAKRQEFFQDYSYLDALDLQRTPAVLDREAAGNLPPPSSDLLKCIHYRASTYFDERGLLYDGSQRRRKRKQQFNNHQTVSYDSDDDNFSNAKKARGMYRMMDGSALMALGILLQEHVARSLQPDIPPGWQEGQSEETEEQDGEETT